MLLSPAFSHMLGYLWFVLCSNSSCRFQHTCKGCVLHFKIFLADFFFLLFWPWPFLLLECSFTTLCKHYHHRHHLPLYHHAIGHAIYNKHACFRMACSHLPKGQTTDLCWVPHLCRSLYKWRCVECYEIWCMPVNVCENDLCCFRQRIDELQALWQQLVDQSGRKGSSCFLFTLIFVIVQLLFASFLLPHNHHGNSWTGIVFGACACNNVCNFCPSLQLC